MPAAERIPKILSVWAVGIVALFLISTLVPINASGTLGSSGRAGLGTPTAASSSDSGGNIPASSPRTSGLATPLPAGAARIDPGPTVSNGGGFWTHFATDPPRALTRADADCPSCFPISFGESGLPSVAVWYVNISSGPSLSATGATTSLSTNLTNGTYSYSVATNDTRNSPAYSPTFTVAGAPVSNTVTFGTGKSLAAATGTVPPSADAGQLVSFFCVASGGTSPYTFAWKFGDGDSATGATVTHTYDALGDYTATCTVTDALSATASSRVSMTVSAAPSVMVVANHLAVAPGTPVSFTATASGGPGTFPSYAWYFGDGATGSGESAQHVYNETGTYEPTVEVTDGNGVTAVNSTTVKVSSVSITAGVSRTSGLLGTAFHFTASAVGGGGAPFGFSWAFGDGTTGTGTSPVHTYAELGSYTATVTATDALGATNQTTLATILVYAPLTVKIAISNPGPTSGASVSLSAVIVGGSGLSTCLWRFGDGNSATGCSVDHAWSASGTYTVTLTVMDPVAGNASATTVVSVAAASSLPGSGPTVGGASVYWIGIVVVLLIAIVVALAVWKHRAATQPAPTSGAGSVTCPTCGASNAMDSPVCAKCGQGLSPDP